MNPSEIREHILAGHGYLHQYLDRAKALAREVRRGDHSLLGFLVDTTERIATLVLHLIDEEEALLEPALLEADAWGEVRVERMERYHHHQRTALLSVLRQIEEGRLPPRRIAEEILDLVDELTETLSQSERTLLNPEVLRDDPIVIRQVDG